MTTEPDDTEQVPDWVHRARVVAVVVLAVVAAIGVVASYTGLRAGFAPWFPGPIAAALPVLVDGVILGASLRWLAGVRLGRPVHSWRLLAHTGVAGTVALNAAAAQAPAGIPWHVVAPAVWAVLVELVARDAAGDQRAAQIADLARIPLRLWITSPGESARTWVHVARATGAVEARREVAIHGAARTMLRMATPDLRGWRVRRELVRRMRSGALAPQAVLDACAPVDGQSPSREDILLAAITTILTSPGSGHARQARGPQSPDGGPAQHPETPGPAPLPQGRDRPGSATPLWLARATGPDPDPGQAGPLRVVTWSTADRDEHWTGPPARPARAGGPSPTQQPAGPGHPTRPDALWPDALSVARALHSAGRDITRGSIRAGILKATGHSLGNGRADRLRDMTRAAICEERGSGPPEERQASGD